MKGFQQWAKENKKPYVGFDITFYDEAWTDYQVQKQCEEAYNAGITAVVEKLKLSPELLELLDIDLDKELK